jgi:hypothetical protein
MKHSETRKYVTTGVLAALALLVTTWNHAGFMLLAFSPFLAGSLIYNAIVAVRKPERRRLSQVRIVVWLIVPLIVGATHWHLYRAARADADTAVAAVVGYKARTGSWPATLRDAGIEEPQFGRRWMLGYLVGDGGPQLVYAATFTIYEAHMYDFDAQRWR